MASMPSVHELASELGSRGLRVMAATEIDPDDYADEKAAVAEVAKEQDLDYPVLLDADGAWLSSIGVGGVPTFVVIGRDGRLSYRYRGGVTPGSSAYAELEKGIERALEASP